jgi:hypothetical protein
MKMPQQARRASIIALLLVVWYSYTLPRWSDWSQNSRLDLLLALGDDGTVTIDRYVANTGDYALYQGRAYSDKAPGPVFLALPAYYALKPLIDSPLVRERSQALGAGGAMAATLNPAGSGVHENKLRFALVQYAMTVLTIALPAAALGSLLYLVLLRLGLAAGPALVCALGYGLATPAAAYAGNFYSHQLVAALLFGAFACALPGPAGHPATGVGRALLCGLLLGWAVISEYPAALAAALIGVYALARQGWRWLAPLILGGLPPVTLLVAYDLVAFGTPWPIGYAHSALWQAQHHTGFMSITYPRPEALWGLSFGPFRGLFVRAPWLLLAIPGYVLWWRAARLRHEWWLALLLPVGLFLFYASSAMWWGGFGAGPRYLVPLLPFLALAACWALQALWARRATRLAANALVLLSALLIWAEALAGQLFPPDSLRNTWAGYVLPAWLEGDIARNLGMALGLRGATSLLPLLALTALLLVLLHGRGFELQRPRRDEALALSSSES